MIIFVLIINYKELCPGKYQHSPRDFQLALLDFYLA